MPVANSKDGTRIAYDKTGNGPAVVLVDGALAVRASAAPLAALLSPDFTVYSYDRRGRGDSADTPPYSVKKEIEDLAAVINAAGGFACLCGTSSGGALALEAALILGPRVKKLALYEVPYDSSEAGVKAWKEYSVKLKGPLAADLRGDAVALFMRFVGMPGPMLEGMRRSPAWEGMEALAPTLAYDGAVLGADRTVPVDRARAIRVPTLILDGGASQETMPFMRATALALAKAIPQARHQALAGQRHDVDPKALAPVLADFFARKS